MNQFLTELCLMEASLEVLSIGWNYKLFHISFLIPYFLLPIIFKLLIVFFLFLPLLITLSLMLNVFCFIILPLLCLSLSLERSVPFSFLLLSKNRKKKHVYICIMELLRLWDVVSVSLLLLVYSLLVVLCKMRLIKNNSEFPYSFF